MVGDPTQDVRLKTQDSLAQRLRAETRDLHERVEGIVDLMRPDLTPGRYALWVRAFLGYVEPWEERVWAVLGGVVGDLRERAKTPLLRRDLEQVWPEAVPGFPRCSAVPKLGTVPRALGSHYVLEGATLGGQHISRHVRRVLGRDATSGCAYFNGYGDQTGPMWRRFAQELSRHSSPAVDGEIVAAARETFATLGDWLAIAMQDVDDESFPPARPGRPDHL